MRFNVTLAQDEDGVWVVNCPSIPSWISQGETREEVRAELEIPLTVENYQVEILA